jgi:hypothetical protein
VARGSRASVQPMRLMKVIAHSAWLSQENQVTNQKKERVRKNAENRSGCTQPMRASISYALRDMGLGQRIRAGKVERGSACATGDKSSAGSRRNLRVSASRMRSYPSSESLYRSHCSRGACRTSQGAAAWGRAGPACSSRRSQRRQSLLPSPPPTPEEEEEEEAAEAMPSSSVRS